jgi:iron complex transport system ATP-binding protein
VLTAIEPQNLLRTVDLSLSVAGRTLCNGLNLQIKPGECLGVLGQNGTGKTTLLHTLMNFLAPDSGSIELCDRDLHAWSKKELATVLGILFQNNTDIMPASVLETVLLGRHPHLADWQWESAADVDIAMQALVAMNLDALTKREINSLSGGERQRLSLALLLTQQPRLYLLDEPGNHLDIAFQLQSLNLLQTHIRRNRAGLCMATHDINLAARFCDKILLLMGDGSHLLGPASAVLRAETLSLAYACEIHEVEFDGRRVFFV